MDITVGQYRFSIHSLGVSVFWSMEDSHLALVLSLVGFPRPHIVVTLIQDGETLFRYEETGRNKNG